MKSAGKLASNCVVGWSGVGIARTRETHNKSTHTHTLIERESERERERERERHCYLFLVLEGVVALGVGHAAALEPAVEDLCGVCVCVCVQHMGIRVHKSLHHTNCTRHATRHTARTSGILLSGAPPEAEGIVRWSMLCMCRSVISSPQPVFSRSSCGVCVCVEV
jgi:hypothetical protein